jgi:hypothetical protein
MKSQGNLIGIPLAMNVKVGVDRRRLEGLGPVALVLVGQQQDVRHPPVAAGDHPCR